VVADDFAGTGSTLEKGLRLLSKLIDDLRLPIYKDRRVLCYVQYAFPEAVDHVRREFPWLEVLAIEVFPELLRAFDPEAQIFSGDGERLFARDVLLQIGRELYAEAPFGFGDIGGLVAFHNTVPNNTLPVFWSSGTMNDRAWKPLFPRA